MPYSMEKTQKGMGGLDRVLGNSSSNSMVKIKDKAPRSPHFRRHSFLATKQNPKTMGQSENQPVTCSFCP
jgi:hypothetical protein